MNYLAVLSLTLDSSHYNRLCNQVASDKWVIPTDKIANEYRMDDRRYLGQYFDRRLLLERVREFSETGATVAQVFRRLTNAVGREKYFIGIDEVVLSLLNSRDLQNLSAYDVPETLEISARRFAYSDSDGVLIVKSKERPTCK